MDGKAKTVSVRGVLWDEGLLEHWREMYVKYQNEFCTCLWTEGPRPMGRGRTYMWGLL